MATTPSPFGRPYGTELKRTGLIEGPDFNLIMASALTAHAKLGQHYRPRFATHQPMGGGESHYADLLVQAHPPCGPNRAHLLATTTWGTTILVENYNLKSRKGTFYEFDGLRSFIIGTVFLVDLGKVFPADDSHSGLVIRARLNQDVSDFRLDAIVEERGYRIYVFDSDDYRMTKVDETRSCGCDVMKLDQPGKAIRLAKVSDWGNRNAHWTPVGDVIPKGTTIRLEKI